MDYYIDETLVRELKFDFQYCDFMGRVKPSAIMKAFSDLAGEDYANKGYTYDELKNLDLAFLISRVKCEIYSNIEREQIVLLKTYQMKVKGCYFIRNYIVEDKMGKLLMIAKAYWILVRPSTRQLLRPTELPIMLPEVFKDLPIDADRKLSFGELEKTGERKIVYSDLDGNGHVFNPIYMDIAMDAMPIELFKEKQMKGFEINFVKEAKYADVLSLHMKNEENSSCIYGEVEGVSSFLCEIKF